MICTAAVAGTVAGLGGLGGKGFFVLPYQIFVGDAVIHVGPGRHFVQTNGALTVNAGSMPRSAKVCSHVSYLKHSSQPSK